MARAERPLDPTADPLQAFAADLRTLRDQAGRPTYQALARRAHRSASSLSEAAGGRRLPTLDTTLAYVRALGGDEAEWTERWRVTADATAADGAAGRPAEDSPTAADEAHPVDGGPPEAGTGTPERRSRRTTGALALAAMMVAGFATLPWLVGGFRSGGGPTGTPTVTAAPASGTAQPELAAGTGEVRDGADPKDAGCAVDPAVTTVDSAAVLLDERVIGTVELRYAPSCGASWPRFVPVPAAVEVPRPARIQLTVFDGDDAGRQADFAMDYAGISTFGNLLTSTRTCVWAQVQLSGQGWASPLARTGCWRGATQVRPIP
ncbi:helix-turn-helix domain-containing protein [Micromonospora sp. NPDC049891]|uniref:helix-turn-helix domain-containing protein n=1 Tax=Micromonospora sp. NPDC049891 TaxID=3155655 RepID=UPI0033C0C2AE